MGIRLSSEQYFKRVQIMNSQIVNGPPRFVKMDSTQKEIVDQLTTFEHM